MVWHITTNARYYMVDCPKSCIYPDLVQIETPINGNSGIQYPNGPKRQNSLKGGD